MRAVSTQAGRRGSGPITTIHPGEELARSRIDFACDGTEIGLVGKAGSNPSRVGDPRRVVWALGGVRGPGRFGVLCGPWWVDRFGERGRLAHHGWVGRIRAGLHEEPGHRYGIAVNGHRTMVRT
ncbi:hypothetical protein GOSPT_034_00880 [Gordonia sputi NBRC 100414]|uniref:Uncharacterized protein n=1 Tax=Gordonia sputi NBRC 100414 TaxID=1089453 RepID=H5TXL2_9ACTN|nr:hypothetical protein GOSPT_034_00880 [Gordonia sputi NBRC 100414]